MKAPSSAEGGAFFALGTSLTMRAASVTSSLLGFALQLLQVAQLPQLLMRVLIVVWVLSLVRLHALWFQLRSQLGSVRQTVDVPLRGVLGLDQSCGIGLKVVLRKLVLQLAQAGSAVLFVSLD